MERLTKREKDDVRTYCPSNVKCAGNCSECEHIDRMMDKLADYEDAEEQGLLLMLPCPIGTTVYNITWWDIVQEKVKVNGKTFYRETHKHKVSKSTFSFMDIKDFGKTVFLTREEAEQALAEMQKG